MSQSTATAPQGAHSDEIYVNVEVSDARADTIVAENKSWTAPKLVGLIVVTLGIAFLALYYATVWTGTWGRTTEYPNFLAPESAIPAYATPDGD